MHRFLYFNHKNVQYLVKYTPGFDIGFLLGGGENMMYTVNWMRAKQEDLGASPPGFFLEFGALRLSLATYNNFDHNR